MKLNNRNVKSLKYGKSRIGGFTLIEMLMVVTIIGLIVSIALPAIKDAKTEAQTQKLKSLTYAIELAKLRAFINGDNLGGWMKWSEFGKYVQVNGKANPDLTEITMAEKNGTGQNIWHWGSPPHANGTGTTVLFAAAGIAITDPNVWTMTP